jgi:hypothetical protein
MAKAIQTRSRKETEDLERSAGARKPKPSTETKEFEMPGEDMKIPQLKPRYF